MMTIKPSSLSLLSFLSLLALGNPALALPGQTAEGVAAWIQAHPTLRPASGERLMVRKSDTPAQRFTFQALMTPPGRAVPMPNPGIIQTEQITLFDMVNGVSRQRLEETLRAIYSPEIYQDYQQAQVVYQYPTQNPTQNPIQSRGSLIPNRNTPLLSAIQGELRAGDRFSYWVEIVQTPSGNAYNGQISVFPREHTDKLEAELRDR